jgi:hypothetical protein
MFRQLCHHQGAFEYLFSYVYVEVTGFIRSIMHGKKKGVIPLQAWSGPEGSKSLRLPDFSRHLAHEDGKGVSPKPGRMEETPEGGRGPLWAVALMGENFD